jgi:hypothetical protein
MRVLSTLARRVLILVVIFAALAALTSPESGSQPSCEKGVGTFGAGAADSPRSPGRVLVRLGGRFGCPENAEWWFEYGTTPQLGQRTASNDSSVPVQAMSDGRVVVRTDVDGLAYGQTHYYRLMVRYPDGEVRDGTTGFIKVDPAPLRPPQRVSFRWSQPPTPRRTILDEIAVHDAPDGAIVTVSCSGSSLCKPFERRLALAGRSTVFRDWTVGPRGLISVVVGGRLAPTRTSIRPRPRSGPTLRTECGGYPVILATRCISVAAQSRGPRIQRLSISDVARASRVEVACRGPGCPPRDLSQFIVRPADDPYAQLTLRRYGGLGPGAELTVFVSRLSTYGLVRTFKVTRTAVKGSSYRCTPPAESRRIIDCPTKVPISVGRT